MPKKVKPLEIVRLSITLDYVDPPVKRRMDVPVDIYLDDLHDFIQAAMGWENCHFWAFNTSRYGQRTWWSPDDDEALEATLRDVLRALQGKNVMVYTYDFGDSWGHTIRIGKIQSARSDRTYPYLVSGTGRCPLEDIGGISGHFEFLDAFNNPDSEYREYFPDFYEGDQTWDAEDPLLKERIAEVERLKEAGIGKVETT